MPLARPALGEQATLRFAVADELFEAITWAQLGIHRKPIGLLDVEGYFAPLVSFVDHAVEDGFVRPPYRALFVVSATVDGLLAALAAHEPIVITNAARSAPR